MGMWHPLSQMGEGLSGLLPEHSVNQCLECYEGAREHEVIAYSKMSLRILAAKLSCLLTIQNI